MRLHKCPPTTRATATRSLVGTQSIVFADVPRRLAAQVRAGRHARDCEMRLSEVRFARERAIREAEVRDQRARVEVRCAPARAIAATFIKAARAWRM